MKKQRRSFTPEFKLEAASLVVDQNYSVPEACQALGVGESALRRWVKQLQAERSGHTPASKALTPEQQRIQLHSLKKLLNYVSISTIDILKTLTDEVLCHNGK